MGKQYDDFVEESNKKLAVILSSPEYEDEEKQLIVNDISNELQKRINDPSNMPDIDYIISRSSVLYLDAELTKILNNPKADEKDCSRGLALTERLKTLHTLYSEKKWALPQVQQRDLQKSCNELKKKQHNLSVVSEIHTLDSQLTHLISDAAVSLDKKKCDEAYSCLQRLQDTVSSAEQEGISYGSISNSNFKKCAASIEKSKNDAIKKEEMDLQLIDIDNKLCDAEIKGDADEKYWSEAIKLSKKQEATLSEYRTKRWPIPKLKRTNMAEVRDQFQTYQELKKTDLLLRNKAESASTEAHFEEFKSICSKQSADIRKCEKNKWRIPGKIIVNLAELEDNVHSKVKEKIKARQRKALRAKVAIIAVSLVILAGLGFAGVRYLSTHGKQQPPYNSSEVVGKKYDEVVGTFEAAGFKNVTIEEDMSGWMADGIVTKVLIGKTSEFTRDQYYGEKDKITVFFSSQGRKDVSSELKNWQEMDKKDLSTRLEKAGFKKVSIVEKGTSEKNLGNKIYQIKINGTSYESGPCYIPSNAPIEINYYAYKIIIGKDSNGFSGKEYNSVVEDLTAKGYKDVKAEVVNSGWQKGNTVVSVSINGSTDYKASDMFNDDVKIVVHYSSNDRIDITSTIKDWKKKAYSTLQSELKQLGLSNVKVKSAKTSDSSLHNTISTVTISSGTYESGDCYVRKADEITITYYRTAKRIGKDSGSMTGRNYLEVKKYLTDQGFTNIVLKRTDDLWFVKEAGFLWLFGGQVNKNVRTVTVNGKEDFKADEEVYLDGQIILLVNTYNGDTYEGM